MQSVPVDDNHHLRLLAKLNTTLFGVVAHRVSTEISKTKLQYFLYFQRAFAAILAISLRFLADILAALV
jgi:hypothetical protein